MSSNAKDGSQDGSPGTSLFWDSVLLLRGTAIRKKYRDQNSLNLANYAPQYSVENRSWRPSSAQLQGVLILGTISILGTQSPSNSKTSQQAATWPQEASFLHYLSVRDASHQASFGNISSSAGHALCTPSLGTSIQHNNATAPVQPLVCDRTSDVFMKVQISTCFLCLCYHLAEHQSAPVQKPYTPC